MEGTTTNSSDSKMFCHKGIHFVTGLTSSEYIDSLEHFEIKDDDVFLVTYPKSGTIWNQQILSLIFHEGHREGTENICTIDRVPWLEYNIKNMDFNQRVSPRLFSTHLPHYLVPKDLRNKKGKVIYVFRNPKDAMISFYYFHQTVAELDHTTNLDDFIEKFLTGNVPSSSWFDHVRGWYTHREDFNILFITYEEIIKDHRGAVLKLCDFLGKKLDDETVDRIVERSSFKNMKMDPTANYETTNKGQFCRRGTIGNWKTIMTVAQNEKFDKILQDSKIEDLPIKFVWDINDNM
ncbi:amine sulfotransferase-like [Rhinatrema bivittatum]|uniref:amine sulfotransferase-like n=1 Tax=Rhinatrema bivittatum TaxID=194408 RepID=UPI0011287511|nr:amine sulfotransferase-like [Rhinatrema bivittatum]XP_029452312.1 amine sulfotransferase-like [Rhinatrema bivittatum]